jgi:hypothetical protein
MIIRELQMFSFFLFLALGIVRFWACSLCVPQSLAVATFPWQPWLGFGFGLLGGTLAIARFLASTVISWGET